MHRENEARFGLLPFRSPLLRKYLLVSFPPGNEMFYFPGYACYIKCNIPTCVGGFPHSEIFGSQVARHLTKAYRSQTTSFIASSSLGIHHMLLNFVLGNLKTTIASRLHAILFLSCYIQLTSHVTFFYFLLLHIRFSITVHGVPLFDTIEKQKHFHLHTTKTSEKGCVTDMITRVVCLPTHYVIFFKKRLMCEGHFNPYPRAILNKKTA